MHCLDAIGARLVGSPCRVASSMRRAHVNDLWKHSSHADSSGRPEGSRCTTSVPITREYSMKVRSRVRLSPDVRSTRARCAPMRFVITQVVLEASSMLPMAWVVRLARTDWSKHKSHRWKNTRIATLARSRCPSAGPYCQETVV